MRSEGYGTYLVCVCVFIFVCLSTAILVLQATMWLMSNINSLTQCYVQVLEKKNSGFHEMTTFELRKLIVLLTRLCVSTIN